MVIVPVLSAFLALPVADGPAAAEPVAAAPVAAEATAVLKPAEKPKPPAFPLKGSVSVTNTVGSATWSPSSYAAQNPTVGTTLTLAPSAKLNKDWGISLNQQIGIEWTRADTATYANQILLSDLAVRLSYGGFKWEDLNLKLAINGGYSLPLSMLSRNIGSLGAVAAGTRLSWSHDGSGFNAYGAGSINYVHVVPELAARFRSTPRPYNDRALGPTNPLTCIQRPGEAPDACLGGGLFPGLGLRTSVGVGYTPDILDKKLSFALDLGYSAGFTVYAAPTEGTNNLGYDNADLRSEYARDIAPAQLSSGNLSAAYQATDWLVLTGGFQSGQPFFHTDNRTPRFPLWDFVSGPNNFSSVYLDANFSF